MRLRLHTRRCAHISRLALLVVAGYRALSSTRPVGMGFIRGGGDPAGVKGFGAAAQQRGKRQATRSTGRSSRPKRDKAGRGRQWP